MGFTYRLFVTQCLQARLEAAHVVGEERLEPADAVVKLLRVADVALQQEEEDDEDDGEDKDVDVQQDGAASCNNT